MPEAVGIVMVVATIFCDRLGAVELCSVGSEELKGLLLFLEAYDVSPTTVAALLRTASGVGALETGADVTPGVAEGMLKSNETLGGTIRLSRLFSSVNTRPGTLSQSNDIGCNYLAMSIVLDKEGKKKKRERKSSVDLSI